MYNKTPPKFQKSTSIRFKKGKATSCHSELKDLPSQVTNSSGIALKSPFKNTNSQIFSKMHNNSNPRIQTTTSKLVGCSCTCPIHVEYS